MLTVKPNRRLLLTTRYGSFLSTILGLPGDVTSCFDCFLKSDTGKFCVLHFSEGRRKGEEEKEKARILFFRQKEEQVKSVAPIDNVSFPIDNVSFLL